MTDETPPGELTEEQHRAIFREELAGTTTRGGRTFRPMVPPRFVLGVAAAFVVLGLGGAVLEHFYGGGGSPSSSTTTVGSTSSSTTLPGSRPVTAASFIGLRRIGSAQAPPVDLRDQNGKTWRLSRYRGRVVLMTFYSKDCSDICRVLGAELREVLTSLHAQSIPVDVVIVNTDPHDFSLVSNPTALSAPGLASRSDVQFLTGSLNQLNATWANYGVSVRVGAKPGQVTHNNVLYFIDLRGRLIALAVPFAHQDRAGVVSLSAPLIRRFAQAVVTEAVSVAR